MTLAGKMLLTVYLLTLTVWDFKTCTNPWWATTPLLLALTGWRLVTGTWTGLLLSWAIVTAMYAAHIFGAADWRLLLITLALFPVRQYYMTLLVGAFLLLIVEMFRTGAWRSPFKKPTQAALQTSGTPAIHIIAAPTLAYVWGAGLHG